jgi:hypothetical protein
MDPFNSISSGLNNNQPDITKSRDIKLSDTQMLISSLKILINNKISTSNETILLFKNFNLLSLQEKLNSEQIKQIIRLILRLFPDLSQGDLQPEMTDFHTKTLALVFLYENLKPENALTLLVGAIKTNNHSLLFHCLECMQTWYECKMSLNVDEMMLSIKFDKLTISLDKLLSEVNKLSLIFDVRLNFPDREN